MQKFMNAFVADTTPGKGNATDGRTDGMCSFVFPFCRFLKEVEAFRQCHLSLLKQKSPEFLAGSLKILRRKQVKNIGEQSRKM